MKKNISDFKSAGELISEFKKNTYFKNTVFSIENIFIENIGVFVYVQASSFETLQTGRFIVSTGEMYKSSETIKSKPVILLSVKCKNKQDGKERLLKIIQESLPIEFDFAYSNPLPFLPQTNETDLIILNAFAMAFSKLW